MWVMQTTTASRVIEHLRCSFATFGLPDTIVTDNGPPFDSAEFSQYCLRLGIQLLHSPPYHPSSNGLAEQAVGTFKRSLFKQTLGNTGFSVQENIDNFLFSYRNTPCTITGKSPSEIMFRQKPKTKLDFLKPNPVVKVERDTPCNLTVNQSKTFSTNERVWVRNPKRVGVKWFPGIVKLQTGAVTYLVWSEGRVRLCHTDQLRKDVMPRGDPLPHHNFDVRVSVPQSPAKEQTGETAAEPPAAQPMATRSGRVIRRPVVFDV